MPEGSRPARADNRPAILLRACSPATSGGPLLVGIGRTLPKAAGPANRGRRGAARPSRSGSGSRDPVPHEERTGRIKQLRREGISFFVVPAHRSRIGRRWRLPQPPPCGAVESGAAAPGGGLARRLRSRAAVKGSGGVVSNGSTERPRPAAAFGGARPPLKGEVGPAPASPDPWLTPGLAAAFLPCRVLGSRSWPAAKPG